MGERRVELSRSRCHHHGGSQDWGAPIAARFLRARSDVVVVARTEQDLRRTWEASSPRSPESGAAIHAVPGDVSRPELRGDCHRGTGRAARDHDSGCNSAGVGRAHRTDRGGRLEPVGAGGGRSTFRHRAHAGRDPARAGARLREDRQHFGRWRCAPRPGPAPTLREGGRRALTETFAEELRDTGVQ